VVGTLPDKLGRYPIVGLLATGGMAEILLGKVVGTAGFERPVVVKRVLSHLARQRTFIDMFIDEARVVASIRHPNVVDVHEFGREGDELFLVMEYLEGESAATLMRRLTKHDQPLDYALGAHIVAEACAGLHGAHELTAPDGTPQHLVHRDVSPHNVFITYQGRVKVIDFGVALTADRLAKTNTGHVKGKFGYMSPEQCMSEPLDRRSDVFALGVVLFELTTGKRMFKRKNELLTLQAIIQDPVSKPSELLDDYPEALEKVVMRALSRNPEDRYPTAADMRSDINKVLRQLPLEEAANDALATLMTELFEQRMERKKEMLQRVAAGWSFDRMPEDIGYDSLSGADTGSSSGSDDWAPGGPAIWEAHSKGSVARPVAASTAPEARRRRSWLVAGGFAALLAGGAAAFVSRADVQEPQKADVAPAATAADAPTIAQRASAASTAGAREGQDVTITVATTPEGAKVSLAGDDKGTTPVSFAIPRSDKELELTIALDGHETITETVVPASNARLKLTLRRAAAPAARGQQPAPPTKPSSRGFRRFD